MPRSQEEHVHRGLIHDVTVDHFVAAAMIVVRIVLCRVGVREAWVDEPVAPPIVGDRAVEVYDSN